MAKGGRYLNTNKKEKKKGKGLKIFLIVLLILALLIAGGVFAFKKFAGSMLSNVNRAEFEEKNQDKSYEDLMSELYGGSGSVGETEEAVYIPTDQDLLQSGEPELPQETTSAAEPVETAG